MVGDFDIAPRHGRGRVKMNPQVHALFGKHVPTNSENNTNDHVLFCISTAYAHIHAKCEQVQLVGRVPLSGGRFRPVQSLNIVTSPAAPVAIQLTERILLSKVLGGPRFVEVSFGGFNPYLHFISPARVNKNQCLNRPGLNGKKQTVKTTKNIQKTRKKQGTTKKNNILLFVVGFHRLGRAD